MDSKQIEQYLGFLGQKLADMQTKATLVLLGGALMITQIGRRENLQKGARQMTASPYPYHIHSIAEAAESIYQGEEPWFALGNFLHDWWCYAIDARADIITEPPTPGTTLEEKRWAAFCAATVEELCARTAFPCPIWTSKQDYVLEHPWFYHPQPSQREWLLTTTPEPFKRHNVFVGGGILDNKYELRQFETKPRWEVWTDEELQRLVSAKEDAGVAKGEL